VAPTVIGRRENRHELAASKSLEAIHDALVCSENILEAVVFEERLHAVRPKLHNISCTVGVAHEVGLNAQFLVAVSRVTPQYVDNQLLLGRGHLVHHFEWALDSFDLVQTQECLADTSVKAHNSVLYDRRKGQPVEDLVNLVEHRSNFSGVFSQPIAALLCKSERIVDPLVLVVSTQQMNLFWKLHFQRHQ